MEKERTILYSDLNSFYASVESMLHPSLKGRAFAVCGNSEERRGIVLAKSDTAKKQGVKTGMSIRDALFKSPDLLIVPPHYEEYRKYSVLVRREYERYTDLVEPYGWDECALDVTQSRLLFGNGHTIADMLRKTLYEKFGLTASIGVSFCKIISKLGSDMKKPDATTVIDRSRFKEIVLPLPITDLCFIGYASAAELMRMGIYTLGDLAHSDPEKLYRSLKKSGLLLWQYANGEDASPISHKDYSPPVKSLGHGATCVTNLTNENEVWQCFLDLAQDLGYRLRENNLSARGVQIMVRDCQMGFKQFQGMLDASTQSPLLLAQRGMGLFKQNYPWKNEVRALCIRAIQVLPKGSPRQLDLFSSPEKAESQEDLEDTVYALRRRFGNQSIRSASLMKEHKMPSSACADVLLPGPMSR